MEWVSELHGYLISKLIFNILKSWWDDNFELNNNKNFQECFFS
jgi:hypothetical protein